ncbi:hypothetical protein [Sagittula stellata]|uniref:Uncharacterized protein n=1 Tax=Sagittula stellata (strain ATCC 700073 / DSM 11524 / E-37) TaxID=388399 RepID=A3JXY6_SAGS3|nr:hypothetical protein [Sagittula stellata]EBA10372.1 hypothetical protein SSE37_20242 [Sagittula stellata E-37]
MPTMVRSAGQTGDTAFARMADLMDGRSARSVLDMRKRIALAAPLFTVGLLWKSLLDLIPSIRFNINQWLGRFPAVGIILDLAVAIVN